MIVFFHKEVGNAENSCQLNEDRGMLNVSFKYTKNYFRSAQRMTRDQEPGDTQHGEDENQFIQGRFSIKKNKKLFAKIYFHAETGTVRIFNMFDEETKYLGVFLFDDSVHIGTLINVGDLVLLYMRGMPALETGIKNIKIQEGKGIVDTMAEYSAQAKTLINQRRKKLHLI